MRIFKILILIILTSCGQVPGDGGGGTTPQPPAVVQNEMLMSFVEDFETRYNIEVAYTVRFDTDRVTGGSSSAGTTVGVCRIYSNPSYREIIINENWWNSASTASRKILMFHELGHCTFERDHDCQTVAQSGPEVTCSTQNTPGNFTPASGSNRPLSMMYPTINPIVTWYTFGFDAYYEQELLDNREDVADQGLVYAMGDDQNHEEVHLEDCMQRIDLSQGSSHQE